jgi:hypothetical protein
VPFSSARSRRQELRRYSFTLVLAGPPDVGQKSWDSTERVSKIAACQTARSFVRLQTQIGLTVQASYLGDCQGAGKIVKSPASITSCGTPSAPSATMSPSLVGGCQATAGGNQIGCRIPREMIVQHNEQSWQRLLRWWTFELKMGLEGRMSQAWHCHLPK